MIQKEIIKTRTGTLKDGVRLDVQYIGRKPRDVLGVSWHLMWAACRA